ncbi:hypothetical protein CTA1_12382 [Colletotrichum tanaceti]|uniref:Uncharacterized protein n=1 Tax=Colletotrichum tanaceti TaxID=1306861 RepID=A0A4U6XM44_9PEZI|nr:hypothetical protein CTA1_12382 [Colletotrichum tanaceti]
MWLELTETNFQGPRATLYPLQYPEIARGKLQYPYRQRLLQKAVKSCNSSLIWRAGAQPLATD